MKKEYTDEEFCNVYNDLWNKAKYHYGDKPDEGLENKNKEAFYNSKTFTDTTTPELNEGTKKEEWKSLKNISGYTKYSVSDFGRVKWNDKIIKQDDVSSKGYLKLDPDGENNRIDHQVNVYTLIAMGFLGKEEGDKLDVHHIDNNGYNCRPENLVLLKRNQHNAVHSKELIENIEQFLKNN